MDIVQTHPPPHPLQSYYPKVCVWDTFYSLQASAAPKYMVTNQLAQRKLDSRAVSSHAGLLDHREIYYFKIKIYSHRGLLRFLNPSLGTFLRMILIQPQVSIQPHGIRHPLPPPPLLLPPPPVARMQDPSVVQQLSNSCLKYLPEMTNLALNQGLHSFKVCFAPIVSLKIRTPHFLSTFLSITDPLLLQCTEWHT